MVIPRARAGSNTEISQLQNQLEFLNSLQGSTYQSNDTQYASVASNFGRGLQTGGKALVNGAASAVVSTATLGFYQNDELLLSVNDFDRDVGYGISHGGFQILGEAAIGIGLGGASQIAKGGRLAQGLAKTALAFDIVGNVSGVGQGSYQAYQEGGLSLGTSVQIVGSGLGLAGNLSPLLRTSMNSTDLPFGFYSVDEFTNFGSELQTGLRNIGITDAQGILQGSSVTGVRRFSKPKKGIPAGTPFDAIEISDFDVAISSPTLLERAASLGIPLRGRGTRSQPLSPIDLQVLGLQDLPSNLKRQLYNSNGREVNFIITNSVPTAVSRGPSVRIPRK